MVGATPLCACSQTSSPARYLRTEELATPGRLVVSMVVFVAGSTIVVVVVQSSPILLTLWTETSLSAKSVSFSCCSKSPSMTDRQIGPALLILTSAESLVIVRLSVELDVGVRVSVTDLSGL